jgi:hypothetical protein
MRPSRLLQVLAVIPFRPALRPMIGSPAESSGAPFHFNKFKRDKNYG